MDKKVKVLVILNTIFYIIMIFHISRMSIDLFNSFSLIEKILYGNLHFIMLFTTSFITTSKRFRELKFVKKEAIIDYVIRVIALYITIDGSRYTSNKATIVLVIIIMFFINLLIEYRINKVLINVDDNKFEINKIEISNEEKRNLKKMVSAVNRRMTSWIIFAGASLSVGITKNAETNSLGEINVIISILVFIWFCKRIKETNTDFYLDKDIRKSMCIKECIIVTMAFGSLLVTSFLKLNYIWHTGIFYVSTFFIVPIMINTQKMSKRIKDIKDTLGDEEYFSLLMEE